MPEVLYNGMLAPITPLAITGAIWYQGESNTERAYQYRKLLPALIADWRKPFGQGDFPFYIVGLPAYQHRQRYARGRFLGRAREAQALTAKNVPHTCLAVIVDTGDPDNIHPIDKVQPGDRLAYCALAEHYGQKFPTSGRRSPKWSASKGGLKLISIMPMAAWWSRATSSANSNRPAPTTNGTGPTPASRALGDRIVPLGSRSEAGPLRLAIQSGGHAG